jgi:hypothetical protein
MGITQQSAAARLIQPGVVDNTAARPASPFEGQCIFQKDTDQLLVWNGTAWVIPNSPAQNPTGLEFIKSVTLSGNTTNMTSCFSSSYDAYRMIITGASINSSDSVQIQMLSGSSAISGNYARQRLYAQGVSVGGTSTVSQTSLLIGYSGANQIQHFSYDIFNPAVAAYTKFLGSENYEDGTGVPFLDFTGGAHMVNTAYDGIRLIAGSNSFTGGTVRVYGYRNS